MGFIEWSHLLKSIPFVSKPQLTYVSKWNPEVKIKDNCVGNRFIQIRDLENFGE